MDNVLEVTALSKFYSNFTLDNITFRLPEGFIMGLIGPNGSGKTTTIQAVLNMAGICIFCITAALKTWFCNCLIAFLS